MSNRATYRGLFSGAFLPLSPPSSLPAGVEARFHLINAWLTAAKSSGNSQWVKDVEAAWKLVPKINLPGKVADATHWDGGCSEDMIMAVSIFEFNFFFRYLSHFCKLWEGVLTKHSRNPVRS